MLTDIEQQRLGLKDKKLYTHVLDDFHYSVYFIILVCILLSEHYDQNCLV
jgi:predicted GNAT family acetyltransferase